MRAWGTRRIGRRRLLAAVLAAASVLASRPALGATPETAGTPPVDSSPPPGASATPASAPAAPQAPVAVISFGAGPRASVGEPVTLGASVSSDRSGVIRAYRWIVDGARTPPTTTRDPVLVHRFARPGRVRVTVELIDDHGPAARASAWLTVVARRRPDRSAVAAHRARTVASTEARIASPRAETAAGRARTAARPATARASRVRAPVTARVASAGASTVAIKDFSFAPATVTVHVGDTVTWPNQGPTDHTATASDGSFDTGILHKGQSGSHTFGSAGTFAYICSLHPNMKGTVNVVAAASGSGAASSPSSGAGAGAATSSSGDAGGSAPASSGPTLANTGRDPLAPGAVGLALVALGVALRRRTAAVSEGGEGERG